VSTGVPHTPLWLTQLSSLDSHLRASGIVVTPDRWLNIGDLLTDLLEDESLPELEQDVCRILSPLLCRSVQEQQEFLHIFSVWWRNIYEQSVLEEPSVVLAQQAENQIIDAFSWRKLRAALLFAVCAIALFAYVDHKPPGTSAEANLANAPVDIEAPGAQTPPSLNAQEVERVNVEPSLQSDVEIRTVPPRVPQEKISELPPLFQLSLASNTVYYLLWSLLVFAFPLFCLALFFRGALRQALSRKKGQRSSPLAKLRFLSKYDKLFDGVGIRKAIKRLHSPETYLTRHINPEKTVEASVRHAGLFTPIYADRSEVPEVMLWVNNRGKHDPMQALADTFCERLVASDIRVSSYSYQKSPNRLLERKSHTWLSKIEVQSQHPDARIVIVANGEHLFDAATGQVISWLRELSQDNVVVVLETTRFDINIAEALRKEGISIAPFSSVGIKYILCEITSTPFVPESQPLPLLPKELGEASRWRVPVAPPKNEISALMHLLREYLGSKGFSLFAAAAAYPEFRWTLIRALDIKLNPDDPALERESRLLAVAQLPWARDGWLPDWLRLALLHAVEASQRKTIRSVYEHLLVHASVDKENQDFLPIRHSPVSRDARSIIRDWFRWSKQGSALEDGVFVELMLGAKLGRLDFELPRAVEKLVPLSYALRNVITTVGVLAFCFMVGGGIYLLLDTFGTDKKSKTFLFEREGKQYPMPVDFYGSDQSYSLINDISRLAANNITYTRYSLSEFILPQNTDTSLLAEDSVIFYHKNYQYEAQWWANRIRYAGYGMDARLIDTGDFTGDGVKSPIQIVLRSAYSLGDSFRDPVLAQSSAVDINSGDSASDLLKDLLSTRLREFVKTAGSAVDGNNRSDISQPFSDLQAYKQLLGEAPRDVRFLSSLASPALIARYGGEDGFMQSLNEDDPIDATPDDLSLLDDVTKLLSSFPAAEFVYSMAKDNYIQANPEQSTTSNMDVLERLSFPVDVAKPITTSSLMHMPGYFFKSQYRSFLENYIPQAIADYHSKTASLNDKQGTIEALYEDVKSLYLEGYVSAWNTFLDSYVLRNIFLNERAMQATLEALLDPGVDIFSGLLEFVDDNVFDENLLDKQINQSFEQLHLLFNSDRYEPKAQIDELLDAMQPVIELQVEKRKADNTGLWVHNYSKKEFSASNTQLHDLYTAAETAPQPMQRWMMTMVEQFWRSQLDDAKTYIQSQWQPVLALCEDTIGGRIPFNFSSDLSVSTSDFIRYFASGGVEDTFTSEYVDPYVSSGSNASKYGYILFFNLTALAQNANADKVRASLMDGRRLKSERLSLRFNNMSSSIKSANLDFSGVRASYSHGPQVWENIEWFPSLKSRINMSAAGASGRLPGVLGTGPWAMQSAFNRFDLNYSADGRSVVAKLQEGQTSLSIELRYQTGTQNIQQLLQPQYSCEKQLFLGG